MTTVPSSVFPQLSIYGHGGAHDRRCRRVVVQRLVVVDALQVPNNGTGVELRSVVELGALAHGEQPAVRVHLIDLPGREQARRGSRRLVDVNEVPVDQPVIGRVAEEAEPLAAVVGNASHRRQVGRGHGDAQVGRRCGAGVARRQRQRAGHCWRRKKVSPGERHRQTPCWGAHQATAGAAARKVVTLASNCSTCSVLATSQKLCAMAESVALCSASPKVALQSSMKNTL